MGIWFLSAFQDKNGEIKVTPRRSCNCLVSPLQIIPSFNIEITKQGVAAQQ